MANKIGSNFLLPAEEFLDKRQGVCTSLRDLKNWDYDKYPIPLGFEAFVDGKWYTYYGKDIDEDSYTGYFRIRGGINVLQTTGTSQNDVMSQNAVTTALNGLNERIQDIVSSLGTVLEIRLLPDYEFSGDAVFGGLFKKGELINPGFAWEVWYNGIKLKVDEVDSPIIYINGVPSGRSAVKEDDYTFTWTFGASNVSTDTTFTIKVAYGTNASGAIGSVEVSAKVIYEFLNPKVWGKAKSVDPETGENFSDLLTKGTEILSKDRSLVLDNVDFRTLTDGTLYESGLYFYYLIPEEIYNVTDDPIKVLVGNMETSSYNIFMNQGGYVLIKFERPQTGILNIEFI